VGFIALDRQGRYGGYCIAPGFNYAVKTPEIDELIDAPSRL
jgi:L-asparaginase/N4-(beta-N-acetylglucosaminyl)-L-asparaginase